MPSDNTGSSVYERVDRSLLRTYGIPRTDWPRPGSKSTIMAELSRWHSETRKTWPEASKAERTYTSSVDLLALCIVQKGYTLADGTRVITPRSQSIETLRQIMGSAAVDTETHTT